MKLVAKPISSPSRVDKFPPPLLRFIRNNGSSRSRGGGRSRSSPIFVKHRGNRNGGGLTQEPEPSSPKVTCMGQVRVRRSKKKKERGLKTMSNRCKWIPNTLLCRGIDPTRWGRWGLPFNKKKAGSERKSGVTEEDEVTIEDEFESECGLDEGEEERESFAFSKPATPPKNALLLMRCRSEPHRGSLKFWDSQEEMEPKHDEKEEDIISRRELKLESRSEDDSKIDEAESSRVPANALLLTRCKSEPARRRDQIEVETCLWKRRLGFVDVSSTRF